MIDEAEFRAFMTLMNMAGQDQNQRIVSAINGLTDDREGEPSPLERWLALCETISSRADARGYERAKSEAAAPAQIASPEDDAAHGELSDADKRLLRTWRSSRGNNAIPAVVRAEAKRMLRGGWGSQKRVMERFAFSHPTIVKLEAEVAREVEYEQRQIGGEDRAPAAMPSWAVL